MGKVNKITLWMNGKKSRLKQKDHSDEKYSIKEFNREYAAATLEDSNGNEVPTLVRRHSDDIENEYYSRKKNRFRAFKPIIFASISAIIIGSVLGFFMLNMFVDIDKGLSQQNYTVPAIADDDSNEKENANANEEKGDNESTSDSSTVTVKSMNAFVLQAGKFGSEANADEMVDKFGQAGFHSMVWQIEGYYYVMAGIANSNEQATQLASQFSENKLEVYVKEWNTESSDIQLSNEESKWLQAYQEKWNESLVSLSKEESLSKESWSNVIDTIPEDSKKVADLADFLKKEYANLEQANKWQEQRILLSLWHQFNLAVK